MLYDVRLQKLKAIFFAQTDLHGGNYHHISTRFNQFPPISITLPPKYLSKKSFDLTCAVFVDSLIVGIVCKNVYFEAYNTKYINLYIVYESIN